MASRIFIMKVEGALAINVVNRKTCKEIISQLQPN